MIERLRKGEDILERLTELIRDNHVGAGSFVGIGAVDGANVGLLKREGEYSSISLPGLLEVLSCVGNIGLKDVEI